MSYINLYEYSREYGGPEEGGWWFDSWECVESVRIRGGIYSARAARKLNEARRRLGFATDPRKVQRKERHDWRGSMFSRGFGGGSVRLVLEDKPGENGNNYSPYC